MIKSYGGRVEKFEVMNQVSKGFMTLREAQEIPGLSYRQVLRIKERFI